MLKSCEDVTVTTVAHFEVMQVQNLIKGWPCSYALLSLLLLICDLDLYFLDCFGVYRSQTLKARALGRETNSYSEDTHCFSLGKLVVMASSG